MRFFQDSKGFTLIELLMTLGLLGIVIAGGLSMYYFADRSFMQTSLTAQVQSDMELAMLRITEEVRLAHSLEVYRDFDAKKSIPDDDPDDVHYLYSDGGSIFLKTKQGNRLILQGDYEKGFGIEFKQVRDGETKIDSMLGVKVSSLHSDVDYELESELQVLNLRLEGIKGESSGQAIRCTKTFSEEELEEAGRVRPRCPYRSYVYSNDAPQLGQLRDFRDNYLARNPLGRMAIKFYYSAAPIVTSVLDHRPITRDITAALLRSLAEVVIWLT